MKKPTQQPPLPPDTSVMRGKISVTLVNLIIFASFCVILSMIMNVSLFTFLQTLKDNLSIHYVHSYNRCIIGKIGQMNVSLFFLLISLFSLTLNSIVYLCHRPARAAQSKRPCPRWSFSKLLSTHILIGCIGMAGLQQWKLIGTWNAEKKSFEGKSLEERNQLLGGQMYAFARLSKKILTRWHHGKIISDASMSKDPYMTYHRLLAYHLYPEVILRGPGDGPDDIRILLHKNDPAAFLAQGYQSLIADERKTLILTIEQGKTP